MKVIKYIVCVGLLLGLMGFAANTMAAEEVKVKELWSTNFEEQIYYTGLARDQRAPMKMRGLGMAKDEDMKVRILAFDFAVVVAVDLSSGELVITPWRQILTIRGKIKVPEVPK